MSSAYEKYAIQIHYSILRTYFDWLKHEFDDIIEDIVEGWYDGEEIAKSPKVKKTIFFRDESSLHVYELVDEQTDTLILYQYEWQYAPNCLWKWHNEPHKTKFHQIKTEPHHQHDQPDPVSKIRFPNYRHRDLVAILEEIRFHTYVLKSKQAYEQKLKQLKRIRREK